MTKPIQWNGLTKGDVIEVAYNVKREHGLTVDPKDGQLNMRAFSKIMEATEKILKERNGGGV